MNDDTGLRRYEVQNGTLRLCSGQEARAGKNSLPVGRQASPQPPARAIFIKNPLPDFL